MAKLPRFRLSHEIVVGANFKRNFLNVTRHHWHVRVRRVDKDLFVVLKALARRSGIVTTAAASIFAATLTNSLVDAAAIEVDASFAFLQAQYKRCSL